MSGWHHDALGYLASALVLATFSMTSMCWLRLTAVASNIAFISYALSTDARPILILHSLLLPMNVWRLIQVQRSKPAPAAGPSAAANAGDGGTLSRPRSSG
jgi:hypothetical protein